MEDAPVRESNPTWRSLLKTDVVGRSWEKGSTPCPSPAFSKSLHSKAGQASEVDQILHTGFQSWGRPPPNLLCPCWPLQCRVAGLHQDGNGKWRYNGVERQPAILRLFNLKKKSISSLLAMTVTRVVLNENMLKFGVFSGQGTCCVIGDNWLVNCSTYFACIWANR